MLALSNKNINLRAPELSDVPVLMDWENDTLHWLHSQNYLPYSAFEIEQFVLNNTHDLQAEKQYRWMIECKADKKLVGCVDIFDYDAINQKAAVGIMVAPQYYRQGYAQQALQVLIDYAFNHLQLHQLYCGILATNEASKALFESVGFQKVAVKKDWVRYKHHFIDEYFYQIINKNGNVL